MTQATQTEETKAVWAWAESEQDRYGDEYLRYYVSVCDDGEPVGKIYNCGTRKGAFDLGEKMGKDRGLEFIDDMYIE